MVAEGGAEASLGGSRRGGGLRRQWPLVLVLVGLAASLVVVAVEDFRPGTVGLAGTVVFAGVLRLVLPERRAGLLAVRARAWDVLTLFALGAGALVLALVVPEIG